MKLAILNLTLLLLVALSIVASSTPSNNTTVSPKLNAGTTKKRVTSAVTKKTRKSTVSPRVNARTTKKRVTSAVTKKTRKSTVSPKVNARTTKKRVTSAVTKKTRKSTVSPKLNARTTKKRVTSAVTKKTRKSTVSPKLNARTTKKRVTSSATKKTRKSTVPPNVNARTTKKRVTIPMNIRTRRPAVSPNFNARTTKKRVTSAVTQKPPMVSPQFDVETIKEGVTALETVVNILSTGLDLLSITSFEPFTKIVSMFLSFLGLLLNGGGGESAEMKYMREQFERVNNKLDALSLKLDEVKQWISWETARASYAECERQIKRVQEKYIHYVNAPPNNREYEKREFLKLYDVKPDSAGYLYDGIVATDLLLAENLAKAVMDVTNNHRRKVMNFLQGMAGLILRGAELDIAYQKIAHGDSDAKKAQGKWAERTKKLLERMKAVDQQIVHNWFNQFNTDIDKIVNERHAESNEQFSQSVYSTLADKYDWRFWVVIAYKDVSGTGNHAVLYNANTCYSQFRAKGNRNIIVASSDRSSSFTAAYGDHVFSTLRGPKGTDAGAWLEAINQSVGGDYNKIVMRAAICVGCDFYYCGTLGRLSAQKLVYKYDVRGYKREKYIYGVLFG